ncbi:MAG: TolC family protein, partial [Bryobacter sp.]|nr:TolC family protein [Bryobacter sp.]
MRTAVVISFLVLAGCSVGPNYERPKVSAPAQYRGDAAAQPAPQSFGEVKWFDIFGDEKLKDLVKLALAENYDVRIAAQRILAAQGSLTAARSSFYPQINLGGSINRQRGAGGAISNDSVSGQLGWELDVWGRVRRQAEAAKAGVQAAEFDQQAVRQMVVSEVATAYFALRANDAQLAAAKQS